MDNSPVCERASEMVSVLYGEASEREKRDFELHVRQCGVCREEFGAFAQVRESIRDWRDEALAGFVGSAVTARVRRTQSRKSAVAALRQFFDLSPLWLKGAVGFAAVVFCVLAAVAVMRLQPSGPTGSETAANRDAVYTKQDVDRAVQEAVAKEREQRADHREQQVLAQSPTANGRNVGTAKVPIPKLTKTDRNSRRPFSRAEREQLAADLRLLPDDERDMYLWAEPNQ